MEEESTVGWSGDASRQLMQPPTFTPSAFAVGIPPVSRPASTHRRLHCRGSCRIPHRCSAIAATLTATRPSSTRWLRIDWARLPGSRGSNVSGPRGSAPGRAGTARRAERQSSTARRALRWSRPVFLLTLTVVAGGCATMGCALSEHHTLHSAPHLRREFRLHQITARGEGVRTRKSPQPAVHRSLRWVCF